MYSSKFFECNNGDVFVVVTDDYHAVNVIRMPQKMSGKQLIENCKYGWPYADEYDSYDFDGKTPDEMLEEFINDDTVQLIVECDGISLITYEKRMGIAGRKLFKELIE